MTNTDGGYLFVHFTGTEHHASDEQIYFALSPDGLHWHDLHQQQPVLTSDVGEKGVRDPFIIRRRDGRFTILATDLSIYHRGGWSHTQATVDGSSCLILWDSDDLIHWSDARAIPVVADEVGAVWAPEAIWDPAHQSYFVFWASPVEPGGRMVILGSDTDDFIHFTPSEVFIDRGNGQSIIDTSVVAVGDRFVRASRDDQITLETADNLHGAWQHLTSLQELGLGIHGDTVEGPEFAHLGEQWCVYVDQFAAGKGYLPVVTKDLTDTDPAAWSIAPDYDFGELKKRHGAVMAVTAEEYARLSNF